MSDYESPLLRKVVIEVGDDLNSHVCLSSAWWSYNLYKGMNTSGISSILEDKYAILSIL